MRKKFLRKINGDVLFWSGLIAGSCVFILVWLICFGNKDQVYNDVVFSHLARFGSNKTIEVQLLYALIFGGCLICLLWHLFGTKHPSLAAKRNLDTEPLGVFFCSIFIFSFARMITYSPSSKLLSLMHRLGWLTFPILAITAVSALGVLYLLYRRFFAKGLLLPLICLTFVGFYAVTGCYRFYVFIGGEKNFSTTYVFLVTLALLAGTLLLRGNRRVYIGRAILLAQLALPCLFLFLLQDKYKYSQETKFIIIGAPPAVKIFTAALVAACLLDALGKLRRQWQEPVNVDRLISLGGCIAIMAFNQFVYGNRFAGSGAIMTWDMRHCFENIIGFQQIFQLGQIPYKEYIPISGMYSVVHGGFLKIFGGDLFSNYTVSTNVFITCIVVVTVLLLGQQLRRSYLLFISVYLHLSTIYNRSYFVLPVLLLLSWPWLMNKKGLWLQVWLFSSFLHGLYYPEMGAAVALGFLPLALWQGYSYVQSGQLRDDSRKFGFYFGWTLCLLPIMVTAPLIIRAAKHTLALSSIALLFNGMARFGQIMPDYVFPFMKGHAAIKTAYYYVITFLIPALCGWVALYLSLTVGDVKIEGRGLRIERFREACVCLALVIAPPVIHIFSVITLEPGYTYSRSTVTLIATGVMFIVLGYRYVKSKELFYGLCCLAFLVPALSPNLLGFKGLADKLRYCYVVPSDYVYVHDDPVSKLGRGFVRANEYKLIQKSWQHVQTMDREKSYMGIFPYFGYYYLCGLKGAGPIELGTVGGYPAASEAAQYVRDNKAVVGTNYDTVANYYLHSWLLTSGECYFDDSLHAYFYNDGKYAPAVARAMNKKDSLRGTNGSYWLSYASSLGSSMTSLMPVFTEPEIMLRSHKGISGVEYFLSREIDGQEADFLYLEFENPLRGARQVVDDIWNRKFIPRGAGPVYKYLTRTHYNYGRFITVSWLDDEGKKHSQRCEMGKGKLLIPLGAGSGWLLHRHDRLSVAADDWGKEIAVPSIKETKLLKLRQLP